MCDADAAWTTAVGGGTEPGEAGSPEQRQERHDLRNLLGEAARHASQLWALDVRCMRAEGLQLSHLSSDHHTALAGVHVIHVVTGKLLVSPLERRHLASQNSSEPVD